MSAFLQRTRLCLAPDNLTSTGIGPLSGDLMSRFDLLVC